ncbi:hypothetical protein HNO92_001815 [Chromobacterium alkanivorans]|uniref:hypothetical protein n=1 Tax=Chromobacterium TaxID=535 RepID=UPI000653D003|nr:MULTISPECIES: hypothetical protein [Chromobacterium]KMN83641.1 hypothetical protein VK98_01430 [Chromobacterium sp. LK11]MCS3804222.1 hypothetical protein [Chromobacterium alkanivorans]MCS3818558.1 hypothetical protein [Chromobacterium alkanivorans]MCS3873507.1 hypothetical protein [Chromobacterium alkanivorans]
MTPVSPSTFAKPPPALRQEQLRLLSQTMEACTLALTSFSLIRPTLAAIQARTATTSHPHLLIRLSIEVLDDYSAQLQRLNAAAQNEYQSLSPM